MSISAGRHTSYRHLGNSAATRAKVFGVLALTAIYLAGCGGSKILKQPMALESQGPLAIESDTRLTAGLDWIIVRDGPGTWSKNADWDEYKFRMQNSSNSEISIESVVIYDSLETMVASGSSRRILIKGTKAATKRYKYEGLKVKAGLGGAGLAAVGGVSYFSAMGLGPAALGGGSAFAVAAGAALAAPVIVFGGVLRGINNQKVANEITNRQTDLPLILHSGDTVALDLFFPLSPSPIRIEINYSDADGFYLLTIDTTEILDGLHLRAPASKNASTRESGTVL